MSTKVYNGCRVRATTLDEAFYLLNSKKNRNAMADVAKEDEWSTIARIAASIIDNATLYPNDYPAVERRAAVYEAYQKLFELQRDRAGMGHDGKSRLEVSLIPLRDHKMVLAMPFGTAPLMSALHMIEGLERFPYWDNTDRDDTVSQTEWDERGEIWSLALGESGIPSMNSVSLQLHPPYVDIAHYGDLVGSFATVEHRALMIASDITHRMFEKVHGHRGGLSEVPVEQKLIDTIASQLIDLNTI